MPFDFKKEYRDLYQPKVSPSLVRVPLMRFLAVEGSGDPNEIDEGLCVQCMHVGPYDDEPATVALMHDFAQAQGYTPDFSVLRGAYLAKR